jgi:gamma-glutamyltranspeptidase / glutathione hydrolase
MGPGYSWWQVRKGVARSGGGGGGVVAAQHRRAAEVGAEVLRAGGAAVDAAIAASLAVGVLEPWMSGLGGGGCMLVRPADGDAVALDFGMVAPRGLDPADYPLTGGAAGDLFGWPAVAGDRNLHGPLAVAVPGLADGLRLAHERFGTVPLRDLVAPAAALAEEGFAVDWYATQMVAGAAADLRRYPDAAGLWLPGGLPPVAPWTGETVRLPTPALAATLRRLAGEGLRGFYEGETAAALLADCARLGVPLDAADLAGYRARAAVPFDLAYRSGRVLAMPGPFAGTALARCLELLAGDELGAGPPDGRSFSLYARALTQAYRERLGEDDGPGAVPACTSHLGVVDRHGNLVALTQTLLSSFGSKLLGPGTGLLLNNGVMWFDPRPGRANSLAPGRQPLSNMCPAIGEGGGRRFALGASGGRRILPAVLQVASFLLDHGMGLEEAIHYPRLDASGPDLVTADARLPDDVAPPAGVALRRLAPRPSPLLFACPVAVLDDLAGGWREGTAEPMHPWADAVAE